MSGSFAGSAIVQFFGWVFFLGPIFVILVDRSGSVPAAILYYFLMTILVGSISFSCHTFSGAALPGSYAGSCRAFPHLSLAHLYTVCAYSFSVLFSFFQSGSAIGAGRSPLAECGENSTADIIYDLYCFQIAERSKLLKGEARISLRKTLPWAGYVGFICQSCFCKKKLVSSRCQCQNVKQRKEVFLYSSKAVDSRVLS